MARRRKNMDLVRGLSNLKFGNDKNEEVDKAQFERGKMGHLVPQPIDRLSKFPFNNGFKRGCVAIMSSEHDGRIKFLLGATDPANSKGTSGCQEMYNTLLKKFHIMDAKTIDTPMGTNSKLDADGCGPNVKDTSVRIYAKFQACPTKSHLKATI
ncbi:hypothetical protein KY290_031760 [Solanum tuberosum]|uniref:Uncharacterized protein n=1 Tax=Solanum tuberosum TaxID=4113 RepID=A0ABQ7UA62_SOLTU|nr:hypothetical protein KY290_031760 [Solanum tuberosum]